MNNAATNYVFGRKYKSSVINGLVAYWKLNANSNATVGGINGTNTNISFVSGGIVGNAASFASGTPSLIDFGDSDLFSFTDGTNDKPFSFSIWVNFGTIAPATNYTVFSKQLSGSAREYFLALQPSGELWFSLFQYNVTTPVLRARASISGGFQNDTWYNVIGTYNGNKTSTGLKLYINKILQATESSSISGMSNTASPLRLGVVNTNIQQFRGKLAELAIFDRVITTSEINYIYSRGISGQHLF